MFERLDRGANVSFGSSKSALYLPSSFSLVDFSAVDMMAAVVVVMMVVVVVWEKELLKERERG